MPVQPNIAPLFMSMRMDWETPEAFFAMLHKRFNFTVDAAASKENAKCKRYWTREDSAFDHNWDNERVWCNPPYGREIVKFVYKAVDSMAAARPPQIIVMLVPSRTDTKWWHVAQDSGAKAEFIKGRLKFQGAKHSAPFPSALLIWTS